MMTAVWISILLLLCVLLFHYVMPRFNGADWGSPFLNRLDGLNRCYCRIVHGLPKTTFALPPSGPAIVVANHISGLDPLLMLASSPRPLRFLIAREQYERFGFKRLFHAVGCIPVDRSGRPEKAMRDAIMALKSGEVVAIFPHGKIHLPKDPQRNLKGGAGKLAVMATAPIAALRIRGVTAKRAVVLAVFIPSRSRVDEVDFLKPGLNYDEIMQRLEAIYNKD